MKYVKSIFIAEHPDEVRQYLLDGRNEHAFNHWSVGPIRSVGEKLFRGKFRMFGEATQHVVLSGPSVLYMPNPMPKIMIKGGMDFEVQPVTGGSRVTLTGELKFKGFLYEPLGFLFGPIFSMHLDDVAKNVKREIERRG